MSEPKDREGQEEAQSKRKKAGDYTHDDKIVSALHRLYDTLHARNKQDNSEERRERRIERFRFRRERRKFFIDVAAVIGAFAALIFLIGQDALLFITMRDERHAAEHQFHAMQDQLSIMKSGQRAFMGEPKIKFAEPISFDGNKAKITVFMVFKNFGPQPTLETNVTAALVPIGKTWSETIKSRCNGMGHEKKRIGWGGGYVVSPGSEFPLQYPTMEVDTQGRKEITPIIVGCILYGLASEGGRYVHRTAFVATISMNNGGGDLLIKPIPIQVGAPVPPEKLMVLRVHTALYAD
jgi:hypothetical protein